MIQTGSVVGLRGWKRSAYTAAKGGIISITCVMAVDYAKNNIRVNCICPESTTSERFTKRLKTNPYAYETLRPLHLLGWGEPIDIAYSALYLASDKSKIITGVILPVDSGYTAIGRIDETDLLGKKLRNN